MSIELLLIISDLHVSRGAMLQHLCDTIVIERYDIPSIHNNYIRVISTRGYDPHYPFFSFY